MAQINTISLRIYTGAQSTGLNKEPIVSVGNAPDNFSPLPPTLVDEQKTWMITHAQTYTLYSIFNKTFNTADGQPGQLLICLFLPAQQRLADGNSPLGLLNSIMDNFAIQALRDNVLPQQAIDSSSFAALAKRYRLEQRPMLLPIMQGHEPASLCIENASRLDALMRHSRYPALGSVARLELGMHCKSTIALGGKQGGEAQRPAAPVTPPPVAPKAPERPAGIAQSQKEAGPAPRPSVRPQQAEQPSRIAQPVSPTANTGGVSLGDDEQTQGGSGMGKKIFLALIAVAAVAIIAFFLLGGKDTPAPEAEQLVAEAEAAPAEAQTDAVAEQMAEEAARQQAAEEEAAKQAAEEEAKKKAAEEEEAKKKADEEARKKAEAEAARKKAAEEEAKKKAQQQQQQQNAQWKADIQQMASKLPEQLHIAVFVKKLTVNGNTVTCTINYEEFSLYDLDSDDKETLAKDRTTVRNKYAKNLPAGVNFVVVQLDKAGRAIK